MDEDLEMQSHDTDVVSRLRIQVKSQAATISAQNIVIKSLKANILQLSNSSPSPPPPALAVKPASKTNSPPSLPPSALTRIAEETVKNPLSPNIRSRTVSSGPLSGGDLAGGDLEIFLYFFREVIRPRPEITTLILCNKSSRDGITIADCTAMAKGFHFLSSHLAENEHETRQDAVGALFALYPSMADLGKRFPVFEDLLVFTGVRIASGHKKSAAFRFVFGAVLSISDTLSDIVLIYTYFPTSQSGFAIACVSCLLFNIAVQLLVVFVQYKNHSFRRRFTESLYVLTFIKPGIDAYRVINGSETEVGCDFSPKWELMLMRSIELFAESIPFTLILTYAFLTGNIKEEPVAAIFSLIISVCSAAFISTGISFDCDTDKIGRASLPTFYGYIPDDTTKKIKVFSCCFVISACQLTTKAFACCLCAVQSMSTLVMYLGIDMASFILYKLIRRDFTTDVPVYGVLSVVISFLARYIHKTITDFTANVHMRHDLYAGGCYWALTVLSTPIVCLLFGARYLAYMESDAGKERELPFVLNAKQVYGIIGGLTVLEAIAFVLFFNAIIPKYIGTFYATGSGNDHCKRRFLNNEVKDQFRFEIFTYNRNKWRTIENDVAAWVTEKIPEWNEFQPEWWNTQKKSTIPDWVILDAEVLKTIRTAEVHRRKRSIFEMALSQSLSEYDDEDDDNNTETSKKNKAQRRRTLSNNARLHVNEAD
ncbi:hypothetical protein TrST_g12968 [Triparma strigata]|uniref:Uncharacterized protein n=1 Tax=Triparma strigata TaxID=1606541 RepID=A0A9W7BEQ1_9STRA|nr:hypothetical protein TrST_g12968 [Triparma strigata]